MRATNRIGKGANCRGAFMKVFCYVYYRVGAGHEAQAGAAARQIGNYLMQLMGTRFRLQTKLGEPLLWMEVYEDVPDTQAFLNAMGEYVARTNMTRWLDKDNQRHVELFQCA